MAPTERPGEAVARAEVLLKTYDHLGYTALNVGLNDLALGIADLRRLTKAHKVALLSANLFDSKTGKPAFARSIVKQVGPLKIGLFGLMSDSPPELGKYVVDQGLELRAPGTAAREVVAELQAQDCDVIIALTQLRRMELERVLTAVKGITLALGSTDMELSNQLTRMGNAWWADAYTKGKYLGELKFEVRADKRNVFPAKLKASLMSERALLAQQVMSLQAQLDGANKPDSPLQLNDETRKMMEGQLASTRARMQLVSMQLDDAVTTPHGATTMDLQMSPLGADIADDATVDGWVKKFQEKFPKTGTGH